MAPLIWFILIGLIVAFVLWLIIRLVIRSGGRGGGGGGFDFDFGSFGGGDGGGGGGGGGTD